MLTLALILSLQDFKVQGNFHGYTMSRPEIAWRSRSEVARCVGGVAEIKYEATRDLMKTRVTSVRWNDVPLPIEQLKWLNEIKEVQQASEIRFGHCYIKPTNSLDGISMEVITYPEKPLGAGVRKYFNLGPDGITEAR